MGYSFYHNWPYYASIFPTMEDHIDPVNNHYFTGLHQEILNIENALGFNLTNLSTFFDRGDIDPFDKTVWTNDWAWHNWDLSTIIPSGTKAVILHCVMSTDTPAQSVSFRKNGYSKTYNTYTLITQVADNLICSTIICPVDEDGIIQYRCSTGTINTLQVTITGWFI